MTQLSQGAVRDVVDRIGSAIVCGVLKQGVVLPKEGELAAEYGVGRSTLREAVKVLSGKGLVRTARRFGTQVCTSDDWNFLDPDVLGWYATAPANVPGLVLSIIELRTAIEPAAAALAAHRATSAEAAEVLRNAEALMAATTAGDDHETAFGFDAAFHLGILNATHNVLFRGLAASYEILLRAQYKAASPVLWGESRYRPDDKHIHLGRAIVARDASRAARIANDMMRTMREHTSDMAAKLGVPEDAARPDGPRPHGPRLGVAVPKEGSKPPLRSRQ